MNLVLLKDKVHPFIFSSYFSEPQMKIEKTVLVIIDALRTDHLVSTSQPLMPHLHGLLTKGEAHGYILHTATPTVTLPRIKVKINHDVVGWKQSVC